MAVSTRVAARIALLLGGLVMLALACVPNTRAVRSMERPPRSVVVTTSGAWTSMIYLARTDSGVVAIDLGWFGAGAALDDGLRRLGATRADVRTVFITHAHRDHIAAWPLVRHARFVLAEAEVAAFTGQVRHRGVVPRIAEWLRRTHLPRAGEVAITAFASDTVFDFGRDTVRAFNLPGHTAGSAAYLVRGVLFAGDAANWRPIMGFQGARPEMSDDTRANRASLEALWSRLPAGSAHLLCTAHAKCAMLDAELRHRTAAMR